MPALHRHRTCQHSLELFVLYTALERAGEGEKQISSAGSCSSGRMKQHCLCRTLRSGMHVSVTLNLFPRLKDNNIMQ